VRFDALVCLWAQIQIELETVHALRPAIFVDGENNELERWRVPLTPPLMQSEMAPPAQQS
jgi:hypothetical protein